MSDHRPQPHSPLKALVSKVLLWVAVPAAIIALVYAMGTLQTTVQDEANRSIQKLDLTSKVREQNKKSLQGFK